MTFSYKKYSAKYKTLFKEMKSRILAEVGHGIIVEHIGSTAVHGLGGKGIIDISIGIRKWSEAPKIIQTLKKLGFSHFHELENHGLFASTKAQCEEGDFHIHISRIGTKRYEDTLAFRDFLRQSPAEVSRYDRLKSNLFEKCEGNRQLYKEKKNKYFAELVKIENYI